MEAWRPIPGHSGYEASNLGRIKSLARPVVQIVQGREKTIHLRERILKPRQNRYGYLVVNVGGKWSRGIHTLVAKAFHGLPEPGQEVRHLNGSRQDNRAQNLAWGTKAENAQDMIQHETHWCQQKTH